MKNRSILARSLFLVAILGPAAGVCAPPVSGQVQIQEISLEDNTGAPDYAFGLNLSPDGSRLYVAVCGVFGSENNRIVEIDTQTLTVSNEGVTGLFPEEIAFRTSGDAVEKIFVSNSTDGSISVLGPDLSVETVIDLTAPPWNGAYPFGLTMGPAGRYLFVTTFDAGELFVIDTDPGPDYLKIKAMPNIGIGGGRSALYGNFLVVPGADWSLGAVVERVDITDPLNPVPGTPLLLDGNTAAWPSANDTAVRSDGYAYVPVVDYGGSSLLYEVDLTQTPPVVSRTIDLSAVGPAFMLEHGIGASPDGNTLVVTYLDGATVKVVGSKTGCVLFSLDVDASYGQINEALFSPEGDRVYISNQSEPKVYVVTGIPQHGLWLDGPADAPLGGPLDFQVRGGEPGAPGLFLLSLTLGPIVTPKVTLDIGWPFYVLFEGTFDGNNELPLPAYTVPNDPAFHGLSVYFQALARDADWEMRPSNLHTLQIQ